MSCGWCRVSYSWFALRGCKLIVPMYKKSPIHYLSYIYNLTEPLNTRPCLSVPLSVHPSVCLYVRLSICPSVHLSIHPSVRLSVRPSACTSVCPSIYPSVCPSIWPSVRLSVHPFFHLSVCPSVLLSVCLSLLAIFLHSSSILCCPQPIESSQPKPNLQQAPLKPCTACLCHVLFICPQL